MDGGHGMITGARLDWCSVNLERAAIGDLPAGQSTWQSPNWPHQLRRIVDLAPSMPDIVFLQGARRFDAKGDELLLSVGRELGWTYRGFLSGLADTDRQQVVYVNSERLGVVHYWRGADPYEEPDLHGFIEVIVDGDRQHPILLKSIDLAFDNGHHRMAEARRIQAAVEPGRRAVIAGRFTPGVLAALLASGWRDELSSEVDDARAGEPFLDRCLTTPGEVISARAGWINITDRAYAGHLALTGVITILEEVNGT